MTKLLSPPLSNIPWQDRPAGSSAPLWRYSKNPIIQRDGAKGANSIFNSAVVPFEDGFAGVFRCDDTCRSMNIRAGFSRDGINWEIDPEPIRFSGDPEVTHYEYRYDPRVCPIGDTFYVTWCNGYHGPTIGIGFTKDFKEFTELENAFLPYNRNGVLFPRKIAANYAMLSRPSDNSHTAFGDIFYSESPDLTYWGKHRHVMAPIPGNASAWQSLKVGAGCVPIETDEGWLILYHGVLRSCSGYVYSFGSALLDLEKPWIVRYRSAPYLLAPRELYELCGDVPNVVFPCAALSDGATGRIAVYYGCADTVTSLAFSTVDDLICFTKENSIRITK